MNRRTRRYLVSGVLFAVAVIAWVAWPRPPAGGDPDGDGRYQRVEWSDPDDSGSPTTLRAYLGAYRSSFDGIRTKVSVPGDGVIGVFHKSGGDAIDHLFSSLSGEQPAIVWDLSTYPPGTPVTLAVEYEDDSGAVIDTESVTSVRPEAAPPVDGR